MNIARRASLIALPLARRSILIALPLARRSILLALPLALMGAYWLAPTQEVSPAQEVPPVQLFVPGFTVKQIPVDHQNINALAYGPDGRLYALGYNGVIHALTDSDGDGLEDRSEVWWTLQGNEREGVARGRTPVGLVVGEDGVLVASTGAVLHVSDTNGDGTADTQRVFAGDWEPPRAYTGGSTDALGIARHRNGDVYFTLGTADYTDAYMVDSAGRAAYSLESERGTVLRVPADGGPREIFATGTRFPTSMAFNHRDDLFAVDQEGATWLLNGNPFDELLHIEEGRHYGFPPRHPDHLPDVVDEPSVYDFKPQHQSVTGLTFNEPVNGGPRVGPAWWAHDAFTTGYSRGKLYRTKLVETPRGYVASNALIGGIARLTVAVAVSPNGGLVLATHSGEPDWGRGPQGEGALYKVFYRDPAAPQPVTAWLQGREEVRIAFDRALDPDALRDVTRAVQITAGPHVGAGDRFEQLQPGYATVLMQRTAPTLEVPVQGVRLSDDRRVVVVETAEHPTAANLRYTVTLPSPASPTPSEPNALPQEHALDLQYEPGGVEAVWRPDGGGRVEAWLPHLDLGVSRDLTTVSSPHEELWASLAGSGRLTLRAQVDVSNMLRPEVQAGSTLDYSLPPEDVTLVFSSDAPLRVEAPATVRQTGAREAGRRIVSLAIEGVDDDFPPVPLTVELTVEGTPPTLEMWYHTADDPRPRPLQLNRFFLPWTTTPDPADAPVLASNRDAPELAGGDWTEGREVYGRWCASCHVNRGTGRWVGPDLSNLIHWDPASVIRDIEEPGAVINPDYVLYRVRFQDGTETRAFLVPPRPEFGMSTVLRDLRGQEERYGSSRIASIEPLAGSGMPEGLHEEIGPQGMRHLLTYLLTEPLEPAEQVADGAPPYRTHEAVRRVRASDGERVPASRLDPLNVLLVAGPKTHGPGEHDYPLWRERWQTLLGLAEGVRVDTAWVWPTPEQLSAADVMVVYSANDGWNEARAGELDAFLERGGGAVFIHYGIHGRDAVGEMARLGGLAWRTGASSYRHGPLDLQVTDSTHPVTAGFSGLAFYDESYWDLAGDTARVRVLATAVEDGEPRPQLWTRGHGQGRVLVSLPGHYTWTFDDPLYRVLLLRGIAWAAGEPVSRLTELATVGARVR